MTDDLSRRPPSVLWATNLISVRSTKIFELSDVALFKQKLLSWASGFREVVWLDSNDYPDKYRHLYKTYL